MCAGIDVVDHGQALEAALERVHAVFAFQQRGLLETLGIVEAAFIVQRGQFASALFGDSAATRDSSFRSADALNPNSRAPG